MYNKIKLIKLVLIFVLFASPSFSIPIKFEGNFIQGSFILEDRAKFKSIYR